MYYLKYFIKLFIFWLIYFFVNRIFFIVNYFDEFSKFSLNELLKIVPKSFGLDISFVAYLSIIIYILLFLIVITSNKRVHLFVSRLIYILNIFFIIVSSLIIGGEIAIYAEWGTKLNFKAISHFSNPSEVLLTATISNYITMLFASLIALFFIKIYTIYVHQDFCGKISSFKGLLFEVVKLPFSLGIFLLLLRGGWQEIPINLSDAYFSNNIILNDITVNSNWNLVQNVLKNQNNFKGNPYKKHSKEMIDKFFSSIKNENDSTTYILNTKKPNIIFILLESWSADNIESLGGLKGITPNFKALEREGLLFTNFYSNGWTSDQGMSSIFSSFPVFPFVSIINQTDKARKLPSINKSLIGYHSSYFFGGQLTYGNIKGYLLSQGFNTVKDQTNFKHLPSGALGVHDEHMFFSFKEELKHLSEPFLSTLFTISSHSPFDFPAEHNLSFDSREDKYVNSVAYTDKCLGDFFESVKNEHWYNNTLFVIVADHSHNSPIKRRYAEKERFKIPMLFYGEVLDPYYKGSHWDVLGSHIDITPSLLAQLDIDANSYKFGHNLFNNSKIRYVPYSFPNGYGLISNNANYAFNEGYSRQLELHGSDSLEMKKIKRETEMFFQVAFDSYLIY
tara:strand:- start:7768 stop:9627 length:1860 start_codon:yes stop_codon:yes gene_type:complete